MYPRADKPGLNPCFSGTYSRRTRATGYSNPMNVLILVLVEHTLGAARLCRFLFSLFVLILVLVEHTLGVGGRALCQAGISVLILVLVEHTLGGGLHVHNRVPNRVVLILVLVEHTLGVWVIGGGLVSLSNVLILVLVEHTLGVRAKSSKLASLRVLILVLVEHTLGGNTSYVPCVCDSLNPCFSGTYSRRSRDIPFLTFVLS